MATVEHDARRAVPVFESLTTIDEVAPSESNFKKRQVVIGEPETAIGSVSIRYFDIKYEYGYQDITLNFDKLPYGVKFDNCNNPDLNNCPSEITVRPTGFKKVPVSVDVNVTWQMEPKSEVSPYNPVSAITQMSFNHMAWGEIRNSPRVEEKVGEGVRLITKDLEVSVFKTPIYKTAPYK